MAVGFTIYDFRCFNQLRNGATFSSNTSEYTTNLVGNVGERLKVQYKVAIRWEANASISDTWEVFANKIVRASGNFKADGFTVGDKFSFITGWDTRTYGVSEFNATVDYISGDGKTMNFSVTVGTQSTVGTQDNVGIAALISDSATYLSAALLKFGIIENDESFNYLNKVSNNEQIYYVGGLAHSTGSPTNFIVNGIYNSWVTGSATIEFSSLSSYEDIYLIEHELILLPYYTIGELTNLQTNVIPELLAGNNSLKYSLELELRKSLTNIDSAKIGILDEIRGVTGWYNENFNGFTNNYEIVSIAYETVAAATVLTGLNISERTKVTITVSKDGGSVPSGQTVGVYFSYLPESESEVQDTITDFETNLIYDSIIHTEGGGAVAGSNVFKTINSSIVAGDLVIVAELEFSAAQMLKLSTENNYLLSVGIEDSGLTAGNSDRVMLLADVEQFTQNDQVAGLISTTANFYFNHPLVSGVDTGLKTLNAWNEDGILSTFDFTLDLNKNTVLNNIIFALVAEEQTTGAYFILNEYNFNLNSVVVSGGVQQIEIDTTRGYILASGDQFNYVKITTGSLVAGIQTYSVEIGFKISWQEWLLNNDVDTVFYNAAEPQNNLNFKTSNYSDLNNYKINSFVIANLTGDDENGNTVTGTTIERLGFITTYDYGVDDDSGQVLTGTISTHNEGDTVNLNGNILRDANTLFKITWTSDAGAFTAPLPSEIWAIHRIEEQDSAGYEITELSSINSYPANNILKPVSGETQLKLEVDGSGNIVSSCLIDYTKLKLGVNYKLSGRIDTNVFPTGMLFESGEIMLFESGEIMLFENQ